MQRDKEYITKKITDKIDSLHDKKYIKPLLFIKENIDLYNEYELCYLIDNIDSCERTKFVPDLLRQVYIKTGILKDNENIFKGFISILKDNFDINSNIVEVGGGLFPTLGEMISAEQVDGTVTVYDPRLYKDDRTNPKLILKKERFDENTDVTGADILVGFMPCEATETILENAIKSGKPFYVAMCGCVHSPWASMYSFGFGTSPEIYQQQVMAKAESLIEEYGGEELQVTKLKNSPIDYPILYRKK